jgi:hypothetical protein
VAHAPASHRFAARCLLAWLALAGALAARADDVLEQRVKSAFLFNFAKFVSWPPGKLAGSASTIVFCLLEHDAMAPVLEEALTGKTIDDHPLALRRIGHAEDFRGCHVAYLGAVDAARLPAALAGLGGSGVLTVYEADSVQHDGVVRFYLDERKVHFEINEDAAQRAGLQLSSRLLGVASVVHD